MGRAPSRRRASRTVAVAEVSEPVRIRVGRAGVTDSAGPVRGDGEARIPVTPKSVVDVRNGIAAVERHSDTPIRVIDAHAPGVLVGAPLRAALPEIVEVDVGVDGGGSKHAFERRRRLWGEASGERVLDSGDRVMRGGRA